MLLFEVHMECSRFCFQKIMWNTPIIASISTMEYSQCKMSMGLGGKIKSERPTDPPDPVVTTHVKEYTMSTNRSSPYLTMRSPAL
jgi:hypothetical protein